MILEIPDSMKRLFNSSSEVVRINSHHFGTRNDTVADFYVREIQSILKDFHFRIQFLLILGIINTALHEVVQVDFSKRSVGCILVNLHSKDTKE